MGTYPPHHAPRPLDRKRYAKSMALARLDEENEHEYAHMAPLASFPVKSDNHNLASEHRTKIRTGH